MILAAISLLIFEMEVLIRLNRGKSYNLRFVYYLLNAIIAYVILSGFNDT